MRLTGAATEPPRGLRERELERRYRGALAEPAHAGDAPVMHERIEKCSLAGIFFAVL
jgi:hypothetical protein